MLSVVIDFMGDRKKRTNRGNMKIWELQKSGRFQKDVEKFWQRESSGCVSSIVENMLNLLGEKQSNEYFDILDELREGIEEGRDPDEIFEYWLVSSDLAKKLKKKGEAVVLDFYGRSVWGRTTSGQACFMDTVIGEIYWDLFTENERTKMIAEDLGL